MYPGECQTHTNILIKENHSWGVRSASFQTKKNTTSDWEQELNGDTFWTPRFCSCLFIGDHTFETRNKSLSPADTVLFLHNHWYLGAHLLSLQCLEACCIFPIILGHWSLAWHVTVVDLPGTCWEQGHIYLLCMSKKFTHKPNSMSSLGLQPCEDKSA